MFRTLSVVSALAAMLLVATPAAARQAVTVDPAPGHARADGRIVLPLRVVHRGVAPSADLRSRVRVAVIAPGGSRAAVATDRRRVRAGTGRRVVHHRVVLGAAESAAAAQALRDGALRLRVSAAGTAVRGGRPVGRAAVDGVAVSAPVEISVNMSVVGDGSSVTVTMSGGALGDAEIVEPCTPALSGMQLKLTCQDSDFIDIGFVEMAPDDGSSAVAFGNFRLGPVDSGDLRGSTVVTSGALTSIDLTGTIDFVPAD